MKKANIKYKIPQLDLFIKSKISKMDSKTFLA